MKIPLNSKHTSLVLALSIGLAACTEGKEGTAPKSIEPTLDEDEPGLAGFKRFCVPMSEGCE